MKELSTLIMRHGAFNAASSQWSSQLKSCTPTSSLENVLNKLDETTTAADLSITAVTAASTSTECPSPTTSRVRKGMETAVSSEPKIRKNDPSSEEVPSTLRRELQEGI